MYVVLTLNSDGVFDPEVNEVVGPFSTKEAAEDWIDEKAPGRSCVEELAPPYGRPW